MNASLTQPNEVKFKCMGIVFYEIGVYLCRDLSHNHLTRIEETAFVGLGFLETLNLGENAISHLGEGVFRSLAHLRTL